VKFELTGHGSRAFDKPLTVTAGSRAKFTIPRD